MNEPKVTMRALHFVAASLVGGAFPLSAALAQSSFSTDDPPAAQVGFLTIPQVSGRGYSLDTSVVTRFDSNFRRTAAGDGSSAVRVTPLVQAGLGTMFGRQQLYVGGSLGRDIFINNSNFNRTRFTFGAGAGLAVGTRCTGTVGGQYGQQQLLQSDAVELADNVIRNVTAGAGFNCQGPVGVGFGATAVYRTARNDRQERQLFDFNDLTVSPQISYASPVLGVFSLGGSFSRYRYPNRNVLTLEGPIEDGIDISSVRLGFSRALGTRLQMSLGVSQFKSSPKPSMVLVPVQGPPEGLFAGVERESVSGTGYDASLSAQLGSRATISASANRSLRGGGNVGALLTRSQIYAFDGQYKISSSLSTGIGASFSNLRFIDSFASPDEPLARQSSRIRRVYGQIDYSPRSRYSVGLEVAQLNRVSDPDDFSFNNTSVMLRLRVSLGRS